MNDNEFDFVQLSDSQEKFLAILPIPSAVLSVFGSLIIVKMAMQSCKKRKIWTPYTRLLVAMSLYDIQGSTTFAVATFLRPQATSHKVWAHGDNATCSAVGFLNTIGFSSFFYNGMLSFYFLLRTKFGYSNERIETKVEPIMHGVAIGYPLLCATVGLSLNIYGELISGLSCWVKDVPFNCGQSGEFCYSDVFAWLFYAIPIFVGLICLSVNSVVLLRFIWEHTRPKPIEEKVTSSRYFKSTEDNKAAKSAKSSCNNISLLTNNNSSRALSSSECNKDSASVTSSYDSKGDDLASMNEMDKYEDTEAEQQRRRMKLLGSQACLFVVCYILCNVWTSIMLLKESRAQTQREKHAMMVQYYSIAFLQAIFYPLQGFCNILIYVRPRYLSMRYGMPNESRFSVAKLAVLGEDNNGDPKDKNNNSSNNNNSPSPSNRTTQKVPKSDSKSGSSLSPELQQRVLDATNIADQFSSVIPLPRNMISSLTASIEESPSAVGHQDNDPRWGKGEEAKDSGSMSKPPRKSFLRFSALAPSMGASQLEVISELSESIFESVISAQEPTKRVPEPTKTIPKPVSPNRSPESRWGSSTNCRSSASSDLPPTVAMGSDTSERTMRRSNGFNSSPQDHAPTNNKTSDSSPLAPFRRKSYSDSNSSEFSVNNSSEFSVNNSSSEFSANSSSSEFSLNNSAEFSLHNSSEFSPIKEEDCRSVDIPIRPPMRQMSPATLPPPSS